MVIILSYISSATTVTQEGWLMTFDEYKGGYSFFFFKRIVVVNLLKFILGEVGNLEGKGERLKTWDWGEGMV